MHVHSEPSPGIVTFIIAFYYPSKPPSIHAHWNRFLLTFNSTLSIAFFCFSLRLHWFTSHMSQVFYFSWFFKSHCQTTIPPPLAASTWSTDNICCGPKYAEVNQPKPLLDRRARIWTTWFGLIYSVYFKLSTPVNQHLSCTLVQGLAVITKVIDKLFSTFLDLWTNQPLS